MDYFKFKNALIKKGVVTDGHKYTVTVDGKDVSAGSVQGLIAVLNETYGIPKTDILDNIFGADFKEFDMDPISYSAKINAACKLSDATKNLQAYKYWMEIIVPESTLIQAGIPQEYWDMIKYQYDEIIVLQFDYPYDWTLVRDEFGLTEIPSAAIVGYGRRDLIPTYDAIYNCECSASIISLEMYIDEVKPGSADYMVSLGASIQYGCDHLENFDINTNIFLNAVKLDGETFPSQYPSRPSEQLKDHYAYFISNRSFEKLSSEEILDIIQMSGQPEIEVYENAPADNIMIILPIVYGTVTPQSVSNVRFCGATLISKKNTVK